MLRVYLALWDLALGGSKQSELQIPTYTYARLSHLSALTEHQQASGAVILPRMRRRSR